MKKLVVAVVACGLLLTGCSGSPDAQAPVEEVAEINQDDAATPQQLASVISEYEADWREVIDEQGECRMIWTLDSKDEPIAMMEGMTCYMQETTATITAGTAIQKLEELTPSTEMQDLVERTISGLTPISELNLQEICGKDSWPAETEECTAALGSSSMLFSFLTKILDAWKPYI